MYSDDVMVQQLMALLKAHHVAHVVIAPGSRHYPLTRSLEADPDFQLYSVVDERSAAFFALGVIQQRRAPVAVVCTSGTAAVNFGSAVAEAYYQQLPLVVLTGDRLPEFHNQMEDQMFAQQDLFEGFIKFRGQLKEITNDLDTWYVNRVINEGLLALNHHGAGPVHLNIPIRDHGADSFGVGRLPPARVIRRVTTHKHDTEHWSEAGRRLDGKRILILWGQGPPAAPSLLRALEGFVASRQAVVFADQLSNLHTDTRIENTYPLLLGASKRDRSTLAPDIVIQVFGNVVFNYELRRFLDGAGAYEHWRVAEDGTVVDPFRRLTDLFEASPEEFLERLTGPAGEDRASAYVGAARSIAGELSPPGPGFNEMTAIGHFMRAVPPHSVVHIANSAPIRMTQLFPIDPSVEVLCNRGLNGIDGCMSSAVGYSVGTDDLTFLVIGDLTFFYDMNSLWIRHVTKNLRILLLNNAGGAVMHAPLPNSVGPSLGRHVSAQHSGTARGWVESLGFHHHAVHDETALMPALTALMDPATDAPVVVEVFTDRLDDIAVFKDYLSSLNRSTEAQLARRIPGPLRFLVPTLKRIRRWLR